MSNSQQALLAIGEENGLHKLKYRFVRHLKRQLPQLRPNKRRKTPPSYQWLYTALRA